MQYFDNLFYKKNVQNFFAAFCVFYLIFSNIGSTPYHRGISDKKTLDKVHQMVYYY